MCLAIMLKVYYHLVNAVLVYGVCWCSEPLEDWYFLIWLRLHALPSVLRWWVSLPKPGLSDSSVSLPGFRVDTSLSMAIFVSEAFTRLHPSNLSSNRAAFLLKLLKNWCSVGILSYFDSPLLCRMFDSSSLSIYSDRFGSWFLVSVDALELNPGFEVCAYNRLEVHQADLSSTGERIWTFFGLLQVAYHHLHL